VNEGPEHSPEVSALTLGPRPEKQHGKEGRLFANYRKS
jgi:hypothetical protein